MSDQQQRTPFEGNPKHTPFMGNAHDPHGHKTDYADILKEAYKGYISHLFQQLVEAVIADPSEESERSQIELFKRRLEIAKRASHTVLAVVFESSEG